MKIATVVGARPQFVKAAVVSRAFKDHHPDVREVTIHTGQHYDFNMSDVFFQDLEIAAPDHHLNVGGGSHGENTGRMIEKIEQVLVAERPDWVLVYGDTDSTLAGAVAAVKLRIPTAHVEAGLRSFNRAMPEEINRVLTDHASDILFSPTDAATGNLAREGIGGAKVRQCGDVMYDAAIYYGEKADRESGILKRLSLDAGGYVLATIHRPENADDPGRLSNIVAGFARSPRPVVWPMHPRSRKRLAEFRMELPRCVVAVEPVGYLDMAMLEKHAALVATDSGGVQKEAFFHRVPCVTLRDETEWVELVEAGWNRVVSPASPDAVSEALARAANGQGRDIQPYGNGRAGIAIAAALAGRA